MIRRTVPVLFLLALHAVILLHSVWRKSATVDELGHLATGLYSLENNDFRCNRLSPPLQNMVCALPVMLFGDYRLTYNHDCWKKGIWNGVGERFVEANPHTFHRNLMIGRCGSILLSMLLCGLIYLWAKELWGYAPALGVLAMAILEPNIIAHGQLATSDTAPALFFLLTGYFTLRFIYRPDWKHLLPIGIAFGLTWASKHSAPVLIPSLFLAFALLGQFHSQPIGFRWIPGLQKIPNRFRSLGLAAGMLLMIVFIGVLVIWICYGFEVGDKIQPPRQPKSSLLWMKLQIPLQTAVYAFGLENRYTIDPNNIDDPLWRMLRNGLPAFSHWEGFIANQTNAARGTNTYFMGEISTHARYAYYPALFLFKTPIPLLALLIVGIASMAARQVRIGKPALTIGLAIPLIYACVLIGVNRAQIGYRHALPLIPFFLVFFAGAGFRFLWLERGKRNEDSATPKDARKRIFLCGLFIVVFILGMAYDVLSQYPHYLSYYNTLAGGPDNGNLIAVDSNLDWGQDLLYLKDYLNQRQIDDAFLLYFGPPVMPGAYGIPYRKYKSQKTIQPGTYIISASLIRQYIPAYYLSELAPLARQTPLDSIAHTLFVYKIGQS